MTIDPTLVQRLSQSIAAALEQVVAPLRDEIEHLRAQLEAQAAGAPLESEAEPRGTAIRNGRTATKPLVVTRSTSAAASPACLVPSCPAPVLAKELCETHYRVMRRTLSGGQRFDPKSQRPAGFRKPAPGCEEPGCKEPHYAKDLCRKHYMAARARLRAEEGRTGRKTTASPAPAAKRAPIAAPSAPAATVEPENSEPVEIEWTYPEGTVQQPSVAMPTAEVVARVVRQYRGGLTKVADVLGRNRQTLMDLLVQLNLMEEVVSVRANERKRLLAAPLKERLADLLFREKLLEDLGCLKEVDESAKAEVQARCAAIVKAAETQEEALRQLGIELGLEEAGLKRLVWRYDLRRQLRGLKSRPTQGARPRA